MNANTDVNRMNAPKEQVSTTRRSSATREDALSENVGTLTASIEDTVLPIKTKSKTVKVLASKVSSRQFVRLRQKRGRKKLIQVVAKPRNFLCACI